VVGEDLLHRPQTRLGIQRRLLRQALRRVALDPVGDLPVREDGGYGLLLGELCRGGLVLGDERCPDEVAVGVEDRGVRFRRGDSRRDERGEDQEES